VWLQLFVCFVTKFYSVCLLRLNSLDLWSKFTMGAIYGIDPQSIDKQKILNCVLLTSKFTSDRQMVASIVYGSFGTLLKWPVYEVLARESEQWGTIEGRNTRAEIIVNIMNEYIPSIQLSDHFLQLSGILRSPSYQRSSVGLQEKRLLRLAPLRFTLA